MLCSSVPFGCVLLFGLCLLLLLILMLNLAIYCLLFGGGPLPLSRSTVRHKQTRTLIAKPLGIQSRSCFLLVVCQLCQLVLLCLHFEEGSQFFALWKCTIYSIIHCSIDCNGLVVVKISWRPALKCVLPFLLFGFLQICCLLLLKAAAAAIEAPCKSIEQLIIKQLLQFSLHSSRPFPSSSSVKVYLGVG